MEKYDVLIIGGGPAGMSAGINVMARNRSVAIISNPIEENPLWKSDMVDNHLGMPRQTGAEMLTAMRTHAEQKGVKFITGKALSAVETGTGFYVSVGMEVYESSAIILATGVARSKKFVGEAEFLGNGVSYCATCDAFAYRGKKVGVVGYTATAEEECKFLEQMGCKVTYFNKPKQCELYGDTKITSIKCDGVTEDIDGVFILRPTMAPTDLFPTLATENGYIVTNKNMETNIKNVFSAGDCTGLPLQVSKAVGEGLIAGQSAGKIMKLLRSEITA